ncbi:unnamed protein product [Orchesella dallaii]|uniref:SUN domain-containing protein n=1 Tax=Orchesella dallaii TaxID=48710 RepID=A0ABP1PN56_9HEXA
MRINNGTPKSAAKTGDLNCSSSSVSTPTRRQIANMDITEEINMRSPREYDGLPPSARRRLRMDGLGLGVNDLRSRRAVTPGEISVVTSISQSSIHSNLSAYSEQSGSSSHVSLNPSLMRKQREMVRRPILRNDNEPHPYGLEILGSSASNNYHVTRQQSLSVSTRVVQEVDTSTARDGMARTTMSQRTESIATNGSRRAIGQEQHLIQQANSNNVQSSRVTRSKANNVASAYSSESEGEETTPKSNYGESTSSLITSATSRIKKFANGVCTYIYIFLMWCVLAEKYLLYHEPRAPQNADVNSNGMGASANTWRSYFKSSRTSESVSVANNSGWRSYFFGNSVSESASANNGQSSFLGVLGSRFNSMKEGVRVLFSRLGSNMESLSGLLWSVCKILMYLLLVIFLVALLWTYGYYLWESVCQGGAASWSSVSSVLTSGAGLIVPFFNSLAAKGPPTPEIQSVITPPNPSSVKSEQQINSETVTVVTKFESSDEAMATLKMTQEEISALKMKMGYIKLTLDDHESRLTAHSNRFETMESEISKIMAAMKAASAKEKSVEQIIDEVLAVSVGETSDGTPVSLKSMFSVLQEKIERARISHEIEIKLQSLSDDVGKMEQNFHGLDDNILIMKADLSELEANVKKMDSVIAERANAKVEIDTAQIQEIMLPLLVTEIEKQVTLSCNSKKCPEGHPFAGLSTEDIELMIRRAIGKYDADKTGLPDLALESAGGSILSTRCTKSSELRNSVISYWGFRLWSPPNTPRTIIQPGVAPGECWAFEGSVGDVVIKLAVSSVVTGFTLEHIPKSISRYGHIDSAPKNFQVLGLMHEHDVEEVHDYGSFTYQDNDEPLQYFAVSNMTSKAYPIVELKVLSNHGNMQHTCIYRFRVHGAVDLSRSHIKSIVEEKDKDSSKK